MIDFNRRGYPTGYQMISSVEIKNFRGVKHVQIRDLRRLNVIVGANASGKTTLLEAIFLAAGNSPENLVRTRAWRGADQTVATSTEQIAEALWGNTLRDYALGEASVALKGPKSETRSVAISVIPQSTVLNSDGSAEPSNTGIRFEWKWPPRNRFVAIPRVVNGQIEMGLAPSNIVAHFIGARTNVSDRETAANFSKLRIRGDVEVLLDSIKGEFPFIADVEPEGPFGTFVLWGRLQSGKRLPLTMISGGINQLVGILVRIASSRRGVFLIDEIENGFFHERYKSVWKLLYDFALRGDNQIIASTHSIECLEALAEVMRDKAHDVRFLRASYTNDEEVQVSAMDGSTLFGALKIGEVR